MLIRVIMQLQWRIQDFPEGGAWTLQGAWTRQIFPKTAWNRKNLDAQGGACVPHAPPRSANELVITILLR